MISHVPEIFFLSYSFVMFRIVFFLSIWVKQFFFFLNDNDEFEFKLDLLER